MHTNQNQICMQDSAQWLIELKGTLMQIWKSANIFVFIWKWYIEDSKDFTLKQPIFFEIYTHEICEKFLYKYSETIEYLKN